MITIAPAVPDDLPAIQQLLHETWHATYRATYSAATIDRISEAWHDPKTLRRELADPGGFFAVAREADGVIVGVVTAKYHAAKGLVSLGRLYVLPAFQRRGCGRALLDAALEAFPGADRIRLCVEQSNRVGHAFWVKQGFQAIRTREEDVAGTVMPVVDMEKPL
jgi:ribosomal protein S18 acetylase RimI-like enzyme